MFPFSHFYALLLSVSLARRATVKRLRRVLSLSRFLWDGESGRDGQTKAKGIESGEEEEEERLLCI